MSILRSFGIQVRGSRCIGFATDATFLTIFSRLLGFNIYESRLLSFGIAVTVTWWLNTHYTFGHILKRHASRAQQYIKYCVSQILGASINVGLFTVIVSQFQWMHEFSVCALVISSATAMVFNYLLMRLWVYRPSRGTEI